MRPGAKVVIRSIAATSPDSLAMQCTNGLAGIAETDGISKKADGSKSVNTVPSGSPQLFVTRFNLSPGASLTRLVEGQEALIFGMGDGELVNEKKSPPAHVN